MGCLKPGAEGAKSSNIAPGVRQRRVHEAGEKLDIHLDVSTVLLEPWGLALLPPVSCNCFSGWSCTNKCGWSVK